MGNEKNEIECAIRTVVEGDTVIEGHAYKISPGTEEDMPCYVTVLECERCGHVSIGWRPMGSRAWRCSCGVMAYGDKCGMCGAPKPGGAASGTGEPQ